MVDFYLRLFLGVLFCQCCQINFCNFGIAQNPGVASAPLQVEQKAANGATLIRLGELPEPPERYRGLIKRAGIEFSYGPRLETKTIPRSRVVFLNRYGADRMAAETKYRMVYDYRSRSTWSVIRSASPPRLDIRLRLSSVRLRVTHEVWFKSKPRLGDFWSQPLVKHELDHVALSSDPRLSQRFKELVAAEPVIRIPLPAGERPTSELVRSQVDDYVEAAFLRVSDLAKIRYQELDGVTRHGQLPVPADSELEQMLGESL